MVRLPDGPSIGVLVRDLRRAIGLTQARLAEELCQVSGHATLTREEVARWERGKRTPGPFWMPHLAMVLCVPLGALEVERVKRRAFLTVATLAPLAGHDRQTAGDLFTSIASGDVGPLGVVQTPHQTDLTVAAMASTDRASVLHLVRWMDDAETDVMRVNAAGILAKTKAFDLLDSVPLALRRDDAVRRRYLTAFVARVGDDTRSLAREIMNPRDAGARWCSAFLLRTDSSPAAKKALTVALHREPVCENVRSIGLILNGDDPCT